MARNTLSLGRQLGRTPDDGNGAAGIETDSIERGADGGGGESTGGIAIVDPEDLGAGTAIGGNPDSGHGGNVGGSEPGETPRKRGRPAGNKGRAKAESGVNASVAGITSILYSLHLIASKVVSELELDEKEAAELAVAIDVVARQYNVEPDPRIIAWVGLLAVVGKVYVPRIAIYKMRKANEAPKPSGPPRGHNVVSFESMVENLGGLASTQ